MSSRENDGRVAIIMRTRDRGILLNRALGSVENQTYSNYTLTIINDGGDENIVTELVNKRDKHFQNKVRIITNKDSLGKWHAANQGIKQSKSQYLVLHDDDDSWSPEFLEKTTAFLNQQNNNKYIGVASFTNLIKEEVIGQEIKTLSSERFAPELERVSIYELCRHNIFPPISYLYKRSIHDEVGFYDENLNALADWLFNIKTICKYDIAMLHDSLANWHIRDASEIASSLQNVTNPKSSSYLDSYALVLNALLREDLRSGQLGIGYMVNLFFNMREEETSRTLYYNHRFDLTEQRLDDIQARLVNLEATLNEIYHHKHRIRDIPSKIMRAPKRLKKSKGL